MWFVFHANPVGTTNFTQYRNKPGQFSTGLTVAGKRDTTGIIGFLSLLLLVCNLRGHTCVLLCMCRSGICPHLPPCLRHAVCSQFACASLTGWLQENLYLCLLCQHLTLGFQLHARTSDFTWVLGIQTQDLVLAQQAPYPLHHLPAKHVCNMSHLSLPSHKKRIIKIQDKKIKIFHHDTSHASSFKTRNCCSGNAQVGDRKEGPAHEYSVAF